MWHITFQRQAEERERGKEKDEGQGKCLEKGKTGGGGVGATKKTKSISTLKSIYCETSKSTTLDLAIRRSLVVFTKGGP